MIRLKNVSKIYTNKSENITAADNINLSFPKTGLYVLLGKSGSGKSTLLNLIGGLDYPTKGKIIFNNKDLSIMSSNELADYRNNVVGFIFQEYYLLEKLTVYDNIKLALELQNKKDTTKIDILMKQLDIDTLKFRKIKELSGGQKARVAIARAIVKNPRIILADEPTGNLDSTNSEIIWNIFKTLSKDYLIIVVTHDEDNAKKYADDIIFIENGQISKDIIDTKEIVKYPVKQTKIKFNNLFKVSKYIFKSNIIRNSLISLIFLIFFFLYAFVINLTRFDINNSHIEALKLNFKNDYDISLVRNSVGDYHSWQFKQTEIDDITNYLDTKDIKYEIENTIAGNYQNMVIQFANKIIKEPSESYNIICNKLMTPIKSFIEVKEENFSKKYIGSFPKNNNEILISNLFARFIINYGLIDKEGNEYYPKSYDEIINDDVFLQFDPSINTAFKITGIYDLDYDIDAFKNKTISYELDEFGNNAVVFDEELRYFYNKTFVIYCNENFFTTLDILQNNSLNTELFKSYLFIDNEYKFIDYNSSAWTVPYYLNNSYLLNDNEIVLNKYLLNLLSNNDFENKLESQKELSERDFALLYMEQNNILGNNIDLFIADPYDYSKAKEMEKYSLKVVNYVSSIDNGQFHSNPFLVSDNVLENYFIGINNVNTITITEKNEDKLIDLLNNHIDNDKYIISTALSNKISSMINMINKTSIFAKYSSIILFGFLIVLMVLINLLILFANKKDFGIMKSLGFKDKDIIKIYSLLICMLTIIPFLIVIICLMPSSNLINHYISNKVGFKINLIYQNWYLYPLTILSYVIILYISITATIKKLLKLNPIEIIKKEKD